MKYLIIVIVVVLVAILVACDGTQPVTPTAPPLEPTTETTQIPATIPGTKLSVVPTDTPQAQVIINAPTPTPSNIQALPTTPTPILFLSITSGLNSLTEGVPLQLDLASNISIAEVTWSSSNTDIAEVSSTGLMLAKAVGIVNVTASAESVNDSVTITVIHGSVASVEIGSGSGTTLVTTIRDDAGHVLTDRAVEWTSSGPDVIDVNRVSGELTVKQIGVASISATSEGVSASVNINVTPEPVASIELFPGGVSVEAGKTIQISAALRNQAGELQTGRDIEWSSDNLSIAQVDSNGLVTGKTAGRATISAASGGVSRSATVTVILPAVAYNLLVSESPNRSNPIPLQGFSYFGDMHVFTSPNDQVSSVTFFVNDPNGSRAPFKTENVAPYDLLGTLTDGAAQTLDGRQNIPNQYTITARILRNDGNVVTISSTFEIIPIPIDTLIISPTDATIEVGQTSSLTAQLLDSLGNTLQNRVVTWTTGDPDVADVDNQGVVTGISEGLTTVAAEAGGVSASIPVSVARQQITFELLVNTEIDTLEDAADPANFQQLNNSSLFAESAVIFILPQESIDQVVYHVDGKEFDTLPSGGVVPGLGASFITGINSNSDQPESHSIVATVTSTDGETHVLGAVFEALPPPVASVRLHVGIFFTESGNTDFEFVDQATLAQGQELSLGALVTDVLGDDVFGRIIDWSSSDESVVEIRDPNAISTVTNDADELCTIDAVPSDIVLLAVSPGQATITATVEGVSTTMAIEVVPAAEVDPAPVATVDIRMQLSNGNAIGPTLDDVVLFPASEPLTEGSTRALFALVLDIEGNFAFDRSISWSISDVSIVDIDFSTVAFFGSFSNGRFSPNDETDTPDSLPPQAVHIRAVSPGTATITATVDGVSRTAEITVVPATVTPFLPPPPTATPNPTPQPVINLAIVASVNAGAGHTCEVTDSGEAYCWGFGGNGQLGNGTTDTQTKPVAVVGGITFALLSAGGDHFFNGSIVAGHTCGLTTAGEAYCWGEGNAGQLGNGTTEDHNRPAAVSGNITFTSLSVGDAHTCALTAKGKAFCWGFGSGFRLGNGSVDTELAPAAVLGNITFVSLIAGATHTCGVTVKGETYCWGLGFGGKLGNGAANNQSEPGKVVGGLSFASVSVGDEHTCGVTSNGIAYCWGRGSSGRLGNGTTADQTEPVAVAGGLKFLSLSAGDGHTCGVATDGNSYCWGANGFNQLGDGTTDSQDEPVAVAGGHKFLSLSAGAIHTCGITTAGVRFCWGSGSNGNLGNGSNNTQSKPVKVASSTG